MNPGGHTGDPRPGAAPSAAGAVGLFVALVAPVLYALVLHPALVEPHLSPTAAALTGLGAMWFLAACVLLLIVHVEALPLTSIGLVPTSVRRVLLAAGAGIALSLLVPLLSVAAGRALPGAETGTIGDVVTRSWVVLLIAVVTAAVTEEVLFRGYAMERILSATGSRAAAVVVPLVCFVLLHAGGWSSAHVLGVVIPLGLALSLLYLWTRNLIIVVVAHFVADLPLVVVAAAA